MEEGWDQSNQQACRSHSFRNASNLKVTTPSGHLNSPVCFEAPINKFENSPPERTASISGNSFAIDFEQKPPGHPYSHVNIFGSPSGPTETTVSLNL